MGMDNPPAKAGIAEEVAGSKHMNKTKLSLLSDQYLIALRTHLGNDPQAAMPTAHELGIMTLALGLETLDLAKMGAGDFGFSGLVSHGAGRDDSTRSRLFYGRDCADRRDTSHRAAG
jgi:hypothetical protein